MAHPALVGVSTGRSVLDAVRAARDIRGANTGLRFAVWGESQGGHAALWTGQLARSYAPELNLMGVAAIVPPTDLARNMMEGSDKNARALLTAYTATSWSRHYGIPMSALGNRSTQTIMTRLSDNYCIETHKKPKLSTILGIVTVQRAIRNLDLSKQQPWGRLMRENSVSPASAPSPLLIATGSADVIVAPAVVRDFARRACRAGKAVRYISIPGGEHATASALRAIAGGSRRGSAAPCAVDQRDDQQQGEADTQPADEAERGLAVTHADHGAGDQAEGEQCAARNGGAASGFGGGLAVHPVPLATSRAGTPPSRCGTCGTAERRMVSSGLPLGGPGMREFADDGMGGACSTRITAGVRLSMSLSISTIPYLADRAHVTDAAELIAMFGDDAGFEAAARADRYRDLGNHIHFCRWRQIERLIVLMSVPRAVGTVH
ncbi:secretory lipase domain-containing protein [Ditylenchus destructor]|uniref:Secretory lipase domain-containing protein n=1 Tax=Ditylenchus destructor TaxID=166010 RepID=A0AAD4MGA1_9BILA|nr:secretory lipase domain-containing protein [Ditylenchus destructor]